jgi:hypothetical protein
LLQKNCTKFSTPKSGRSFYTHKESFFDEFVFPENIRIKTDMGEDSNQVWRHEIFLFDLCEKIWVELNIFHKILHPKLVIEE